MIAMLQYAEGFEKVSYDRFCEDAGVTDSDYYDSGNEGHKDDSTPPVFRHTFSRYAIKTKTVKTQ